MSTQRLLKFGTDKSLLAPSGIQQIDLRNGGMNGYIPPVGIVDTDGRVKSGVASNSHYLRPNLIPVLLSYPGWYDFLPADMAEFRKGYLKSLIEELPMRIEGINAKLSVESDETPIGGAGETIAEPTNVKRDKSSISFVYTEKMNKAIMYFLEEEIMYGIMDPHTKLPMSRTFIDESSINYLYSLDFWSFTIAFIEPTRLGQGAIDGFICTNCWFDNAGDRIGGRDLTGNSEKVEITVTFNPVTSVGPMVTNYCDQLLKKMSIIKTAPTDIMLPAATVKDPDLAAMTDIGYDRVVTTPSR